MHEHCIRMGMVKNVPCISDSNDHVHLQWFIHLDQTLPTQKISFLLQTHQPSDEHFNTNYTRYVTISVWLKIMAIKQIHRLAVTRIPWKVCPIPYWYTSITRKPTYYTTTSLLTSHYKWCKVHFSSVLHYIWKSNPTVPTFHPCPSDASTIRTNRSMPGYKPWCHCGTNAWMSMVTTGKGLLCTCHLISVCL